MSKSTHTPILTLLLIAACWWPTPSLASDWVEASGQAMVDGDEGAARNQAIAVALRFCVEQVTGMVIKSSFSHTQREVLKDKKHSFLSDVSDKITTSSSGYVETYEILSEKRRGESIVVELRAKVYESKIQAQLAGLVQTLSATGKTKMILAIQDVRYANGSDQPRVMNPSVIRSALEGALTRAGGKLVAASLAKRVSTAKPPAYDKWEATQALKDAKQFGANFLLLGRIEVRNQGLIQGETVLTNLNGQTRIEITGSLRGIDVQTGALLSSQDIQMSSIGSNFERALKRALKGQGNNMVVQTFNKLLGDLKAQL